MADGAATPAALNASSARPTRPHTATSVLPCGLGLRDPEVDPARRRAVAGGIDCHQRHPVTGRQELAVADTSRPGQHGGAGWGPPGERPLLGIEHAAPLLAVLVSDPATSA